MRAHIHRVEFADPASPSTLATCHELYPFPILSHICLLLSCIVPPSLPHFLLVLFLLFISYFTAYFVLFPACGCASERWHRSRCPQLNIPATLFPTHFLRILLPLCLLCFPAALLSFLLQKRKRGGRVTPPLNNYATLLERGPSQLLGPNHNHCKQPPPLHCPLAAVNMLSTVVIIKRCPGMWF